MQTVQDIADQATFDDAMYAIYVCQKLEHYFKQQSMAMLLRKKIWKSDT